LGGTLGGTELVVLVGDRAVGLPLDDVSEVIALGDMTPVPGTPSAVRGLVHLRGQLIPVVDLQSVLGRTIAADPLVGAALVVVEARRGDEPLLRAALMVDRVVGLGMEVEQHLDVAGTLSALRMERP